MISIFYLIFQNTYFEVLAVYVRVSCVSMSICVWRIEYK